MDQKRSESQQPKRVVNNILVVCHGNICRSPLAGAILKLVFGEARVRDRGLSPNRQGAIVAKKVREYAERNGINLVGHRAQRMTEEDVAWADVILYMDAANRRRLAEYPGASEKAHCLAGAIGAERIPDPNYTARGEELDRLLGLVVSAARAYAEKGVGRAEVQ